jgi:hypothetical protein
VQTCFKHLNPLEESCVRLDNFQNIIRGTELRKSEVSGKRILNLPAYRLGGLAILVIGPDVGMVFSLSHSRTAISRTLSHEHILIEDPNMISEVNKVSAQPKEARVIWWNLQQRGG